MTTVVVVIIVAVVVLAAAWFVAGRRRGTDGVDSFRRQIDALSAEARRSTVDQVKEQSKDLPATEPEDGADG